MNELQKIAEQLDKTRFRLLINEEALDDELKETWNNFIKELLKLNEMLLALDKREKPRPFYHCPNCGCTEMLCGYTGLDDSCTSERD